jgi:hypothetical protein
MRYAHHFLKYVREADSNTINLSIQSPKPIHQSNAQTSQHLNFNLFPIPYSVLILTQSMDPNASPSDDPIIKTMQDPPARVPFEPTPPVGPAPDGTAMSTPKNLGNPPSIDIPKPATKPQIAYRPPDAPKESTRSTPPMTPPTSPSPFVATNAPAQAAATPSAPPERPARSGSATTVALSALTLLLVAIGLPLVWLKTNASATSAADATSKTRQDLSAIASKIDGFNATTKLIQDANAAAKQDLFNAGADELTCADTTSKVADVLLAEGNRLKAEGDAAKDQPKAQQGQWLIDRANELKQTSTACAASGTNAQTRSGIPVNK